MYRSILTPFLLLNLIACTNDVGSMGKSELTVNNMDVFISNGKLQCQNNALPTTTTKAYLVDAGIEVESQSCGLLNGMLYASVCGGGTAQVHVFSINSGDLDKAIELGFTSVNKTSSGITKVKCESFYTPKPSARL